MQEGLSTTDAARRLLIDHSRYGHIERGERRPGLLLAIRMHRMTDGAVSILDWYPDNKVRA